MYKTEIIVQPEAPTISLQKLLVGRYSYSEVKVKGIPSTATSITLVITPVNTELNPVPFLVDLVTKSVFISEAMFPDLGSSTYEIYFRDGGHNYWCGKGKYTVESTSLNIDTGTIIDDIYAEKVVRGVADIIPNTRVNFIEVDTTKYDLLSAYIVVPEGSAIAYNVTNVQVLPNGIEVYYNATVAESGHVLRYSLMMKG